MAQQQESLEDFLTPITPTKGSKMRSATPATSPRQNIIVGGAGGGHHHHDEAPESPSKQQARSRLGSLLGQIRTGDLEHGPKSGDEQRDLDSFFDEDMKSGKRGGKKMKREKRVVFELRGKPFGLRDSGHPETIYALCRKWMYGKEDELPDQQHSEDDPHEFEATSNFRSLDLLATKEIHVLPPPRADMPMLDPRPQRVLARRGADAQRPHAPLLAMKTDAADVLLADHKKHWKSVKKNWCDYNQKREQRYADSLQLLRTVYGIAQQNQPTI